VILLLTKLTNVLLPPPEIVDRDGVENEEREVEMI
jgi:hypothetical protein